MMIHVDGDVQSSCKRSPTAFAAQISRLQVKRALPPHGLLEILDYRIKGRSILTAAIRLFSVHASPIKRPGRDGQESAPQITS